MTRRTGQWRGASSGPDWRDTQAMMVEIEKTHACTVYVHMRPRGYSPGAGWEVTCVAQLMTVPGPAGQPTVAVGGTWPHRDHATLESFVYGLLVKLDWDIGSDSYVQQEIPF